MKAGDGQIIIFILFLVFAIPASVTDIKYRRIPDCSIYSGIIVLSILRLFICKDPALIILMELFSGALLFYAVRILTGEKLGMGDVKFAALMGVFSRFPGWFTAVAIASLTALIFALPALAAGKIQKSYMLPFAPFLTAGSIAAYFLKEYFL